VGDSTNETFHAVMTTNFRYCVNMLDERRDSSISEVTEYLHKQTRTSLYETHI